MDGLALTASGALTAGLIWLAVPVVLVALVRMRLGVALPVALIGMLTFLVAWCGSVVTAGLMSCAGVEASSLTWALVVSCSAGICEETARTLAFRTSYLRKQARWNTTLMHTLGHAGIESVIEAFTYAATFALVLGAADLVPDTELARLTALTSRELVFVALLRVTLGPVIHGLFATFAAAAVSQGRPLLWGVAVALHAGHDIVAHRIGLAGETATTVWLAATFVAYSALILWLRRVWSEDAAGEAVSPD